jgi:hypothetical protein
MLSTAMVLLVLLMLLTPPTATIATTISTPLTAILLGRTRGRWLRRRNIARRRFHRGFGSNFCRFGRRFDGRFGSIRCSFITRIRVIPIGDVLKGRLRGRFGKRL